MANVKVEKPDVPPVKVILEMDLDEAIWLTALTGAVHDSYRVGPWNYAIYNKLSDAPDLKYRYHDVYNRIKRICRLSDISHLRSSEPVKEVPAERWEFKFYYSGSEPTESEWCRITDQTIDWSEYGDRIIKVAFRRAK